MTIIILLSSFNCFLGKILPQPPFFPKRILKKMAVILDRVFALHFWLLFGGESFKKQLSHDKKFPTLFLSSFPYRFFVVYSTKSTEEDGRDDEEEYYEKQRH